MAHSRHLPWRLRITAIFLAVLFTLAGAREGIAGYYCARHSDHGEQAPDSHAGHTAAATATAASDGAHSHGQGEPCSCIGDCQASQTSARPNSEPWTDEVYATPCPCPPATAETRLPGSPKFLLPFSNGPPSLG